MKSSKVPSRKYGQVFLKSMEVARFEVESLYPEPGESVLEIGSGPGIITSELINAFSSVTALEPDHVLYANLTDRFSPQIEAGNVKILKESFLDFPAANYDKIIGNIPYHISSPIIFHLREFSFKRCILMVQEEFANRLIASPGESEYSRLSVNASLHFRIEKLRSVPRSLFSPAPKVDSTIVALEKKTDFYDLDSSSFDKVLIKLFSNRRKMVRSIMDSYPADLAERRPDTLTTEEIIRIFNTYDGKFTSREIGEESDQKNI
jgi:16S rRNA (adenine1518-N6/adenine1519-N6)-dimethyltransferase